MSRRLFIICKKIKHILMAGDASVLAGIELVIISTLKHNKNIHWHICTMDINTERSNYIQIADYYKDWLKKLVKYLDYNSEITFIDTYEIYQKYFSESVNNNSFFSPYAGIRLLSDILFPELDKILYLDCDVIINNSLDGLYNIYPRENKPYAAYVIPDACDGFGEMISGVIMFNLKECRETKILDLARYNYNKILYQYPDQSSLAEACDPDPLPEDWDYIHDYRLISPNIPSIIHFTNKNFPKVYHNNKGDFFKCHPLFKNLHEELEMIKTLK